MGILASLGWGRASKLVMAALAAASATDGPIIVVGAPGLARLLADQGLGVLPPGRSRASIDALLDSVTGGSLAAIVARDAGEPGDGWRRALRPGGAVVLVGGADAAEQSRQALCAGLVDLEQRRAGRLVITSGRTWMR